MEGSNDASVVMSDSQVEGGETATKPEEGPVEEPCDGSKAGLSNSSEAPAAPAAAVTPAGTEAAAGVTLKVATTLLHPVCLGESPLMLPIHLQMARAAGPQLGQMGAAPYLITSQNPVPLPLVLDQQVLQHVGPSVLPQNPQLPLQSGVLCQNSFGLPPPPPSDQKSPEQPPDANLLSLLQNPAFAAIVQDLFPSQAAAAASSSCQSPGSAFFPLPPPPLTPPYASPLAPLVPPATLLVPYPVIIPLPVPLPIPLPIPVPVPLAEDSKGNLPKAVCTVSRSTQTSLKDATSPASSARSCKPSPSSFQPAATSPPPLPSGDGEALDLSVRGCPVQLKQEYPSPQPDSVLDLSLRPFRNKPLPPNTAAAATHLPLGVERSQSLDSKLLGSLASLEFSRQHKWVVDSSSGRVAGVSAGSASRNPEASLGSGGNLEIVSASQTAKVIVSVKDGIPAILCGKIKGLSGVSTKNFSIKRDGTSAAALQQLYAVPSGSQGEPGDPSNALKKVPKSRAIKLKKVSSQEIHFLPVKKQRLAALLPRK